jgi:hypothetical protein
VFGNAELRGPRFIRRLFGVLRELLEESFNVGRPAQHVVVEPRHAPGRELSIEGPQQKGLMSVGVLLDGETNLKARSIVSRLKCREPLAQTAWPGEEIKHRHEVPLSHLIPRRRLPVGPRAQSLGVCPAAPWRQPSSNCRSWLTWRSKHKTLAKGSGWIVRYEISSGVSRDFSPGRLLKAYNSIPASTFHDPVHAPPTLREPLPLSRDHNGNAHPPTRGHHGCDGVLFGGLFTSTGYKEPRDVRRI